MLSQPLLLVSLCIYVCMNVPMQTRWHVCVGEEIASIFSCLSFSAAVQFRHVRANMSL